MSTAVIFIILMCILILILPITLIIAIVGRIWKIETAFELVKWLVICAIIIILAAIL